MPALQAQKSAPHFGTSISSSLQVPVGRKHAEVNKTERFRIQAAIRFRHALRGEWDVLNSLQDGMTQSREGWFESSHSKLPSLGASGSGSASPMASPASPSAGGASNRNSEKLPPVTWTDAASKFERRQKEGNWATSHRQSLTNWSKDSFAACSRQTQSMPNLKSHGGTMSGMSPAEAKAAADARIAAIYSAEAKVLEKMPSVPQRFGKEALVRVRHLAEASKDVSSGKTASGENHSGLTDNHRYACQLCHGRHDLSVPCKDVY
jgi:hypothetical protein